MIGHNSPSMSACRLKLLNAVEPTVPRLAKGLSKANRDRDSSGPRQLLSAFSVLMQTYMILEHQNFVFNEYRNLRVFIHFISVIHMLLIE